MSSKFAYWKPSQILQKKFLKNVYACTPFINLGQKRPFCLICGQPATCCKTQPKTDGLAVAYGESWGLRVSTKLFLMFKFAFTFEGYLFFTLIVSNVTHKYLISNKIIKWNRSIFRNAQHWSKKLCDAPVLRNPNFLDYLFVCNF